MWKIVFFLISISDSSSYSNLLNYSEFEELEAVPTMAVMEGMLEPPSTASAATDAAEDSSFVNFFSVCTLPQHHSI